MSFRIVRGASAIVMSLAATSSLFAGSDCGCVMPNGCKGVSLCHTQPNIDWNRFHVDIGFILEQARVTGAAYAYTAPTLTGTAPTALTTFPQTNVVIQTPTFNVDFGVTADIGYAFEHDNWCADIRFDWLSTTGSGSISPGFGQTVIPMNIWQKAIAAGTDIQSVASASTNFAITYYNLMLDLGRGTYITECFSINPHAGLKFSFIYDTITDVYTLNAGSALTRVSGTDFWGVGPSFGLDTDWSLAEGWCVFLDTNAAILLSYATATDSLVYSSNTTYSTGATTGQMPTFAPTIRALLGLSYERKIYCDEQMIRLRAGWDTSIYWNQFNHIDVVNGAGTTAATASAGQNLTSFFLREGSTFGLTGLLFELGWSF